VGEGGRRENREQGGKDEDRDDAASEQSGHQVIGTRGARPRGAADRSGAHVAPQAPRWAPVLGVALLAGWAALSCASGGIDLGDGLGGRGPTAAFVALALAAPAAAWTLWAARAE